jgi:hypothetical protein
MIGFIDTFFHNLSYSQSIITLALIYPLHKSLGHTIRFLAMDLSHKLSLHITMKSSCHFLFNHLGLPTLQNSIQFSDSNSLIPCRYKQTLVIEPRDGPHRDYLLLLGMRVYSSVA